MKSFIPAGYQSLLSIYETQKAISLLKRLFEDRLGALLNLYRVSAPLFVAEDSGLNDNLNGVERPVDFDILRSKTRAEVVQSLAKWKRLALKRYDFHPGKGLYTDMNAIRRDEDELENLHSVYVDQWDWEKVIRPEERNLDYLHATVRDIVRAICDTQDTMQAIYPQLQRLGKLERRVTFVSAQALVKAPARRAARAQNLRSMPRSSAHTSAASAASPAPVVSTTGSRSASSAMRSSPCAARIPRLPRLRYTRSTPCRCRVRTEASSPCSPVRASASRRFGFSARSFPSRGRSRGALAAETGSA